MSERSPTNSEEKRVRPKRPVYMKTQERLLIYKDPERDPAVRKTRRLIEDITPIEAREISEKYGGVAGGLFANEELAKGFATDILETQEWGKFADEYPKKAQIYRKSIEEINKILEHREKQQRATAAQIEQESLETVRTRLGLESVANDTDNKNEAEEVVEAADAHLPADRANEAAQERPVVPEQNDPEQQAGGGGENHNGQEGGEGNHGGHGGGGHGHKGAGGKTLIGGLAGLAAGAVGLTWLASKYPQLLTYDYFGIQFIKQFVFEGGWKSVVNSFTDKLFGRSVVNEAGGGTKKAAAPKPAAASHGGGGHH